MNKFTTETLDKAYLEYSNITEAKTRKEIELEQKLETAQRVIESLKAELKRERGTVMIMGEENRNVRIPCSIYTDFGGRANMVEWLRKEVKAKRSD